MSKKTHNRWIHGVESGQIENLRVRQEWLYKVITMPPSEEDQADEDSHAVTRAALVERLQRMFKRLPPREREFLELYYIYGKSQGQIADIHGVTQEAICYRLKRAMERLRFINQMIDIDLSELKRDLKTIFKDGEAGRFTATVMREFINFSSQSRVAKKLGRSTFKVRLTLQHGVKVLESLVQTPEPHPALSDRVSQYLRIYKLMMQRYLILVEKAGKWKTAQIVV